MENEAITIEEAIIATTLERISQKVNHKAWIEILVDWQASGKSEPTSQMQAVLFELTREIKLHLGDKAAINVKLPLH